MACLTARAAGRDSALPYRPRQVCKLPPLKSRCQIVRAEINRFLSQFRHRTAVIELRLARSALLLRNHHPKEPLPEVCNSPIPEGEAEFLQIIRTEHRVSFSRRT